jgi:hypothetical protein
LSDIVPHDCVSPTNRSPEGECDPITAVMPDFDGLIGWVTRRGRVGTINQGSGTTPTLLGDDYVTIADNADGRMNLIVYRRAQGFVGQRPVCSVPIFVEGHSVTDNSMIGFNRSIILENNAGYTHARGQHDWSNAGGGITRIDIREDESGCDTVWDNL